MMIKFFIIVSFVSICPGLMYLRDTTNEYKPDPIQYILRTFWNNPTKYTQN